MDSSSILPSPTPEHRRVAAGQFERANQVIATGNFDYGIRLLLSCCKLDPANLVFRQALRRTEKAKYRNNLRGSMLAWLTTWPSKARVKAALASRDYLKVLEHCEDVLTRNPWDVGTQMDMAGAADVLGLLDLAIWTLEQARQKRPLHPPLNRALAKLYAKRGNFVQAIALWELVRKVLPRDLESQHMIKDLAVHHTISRGQYEAALGKGPRGDDPDGEAEAEDVEEAPELLPADSSPFGASRVAREATPIRAKLQSDPTNVNTHLQLARLYRRADELDLARLVLQEALAPTGNAFEIASEMADLEIEQFRQNLTVAEEKLRTRPDDPELRKLRIRLRKEINARELELYRQKMERFPLELGHRFEVGLRLLRGGQVEEAIQELQRSRADPRYRGQSLLYLGHCFKARNNWRLAQRNFEEALQNVSAGDTATRKDILFELAQGCAENGDLAHAVDLGLELANLDFGFRDIGRLIDGWQVRLQQENAPGSQSGR